MILTAQEEYGLRCALCLARAQRRGEGGDGSLTLGEVAEREGMTTAYAGKLLRVLVQGGLVDSTRGRGGGYSLARVASEVPVSEVLQVLGSKFYDGEICTKAPGVVDDKPAFCVHNSNCSIRSLWTGLQSLIDGFLAGLSLADLVGDEDRAGRRIEANAQAALGRQEE